MENFNLKDLKNKKVHFVGIGGISMSCLAMMLKANKIYVQGSDETENAEVKKLQKKGIKIFVGHNEKNVDGMDVVVYSSAITNDNEELVCARRKGLLIIKRAELLGMVASGYKTVVSVAGSHGKTTATAMISEMLLKNDFKPTLHIGGVLNSIHSNHKIGNKKIFVTESCEYKDNFLFLKPDISVVLNVDADHLDYFGNLEGVKNSFLKFAKNTKEGGINIVSFDDKNSSEIANLENSITFGFDKKANVYACKIKEYKPCHYSFDVVFSRFNLGNIKLNILGKHNIFNALACVLVGLALQIDFCDIKDAIENFSGVERRCQLISSKNDILIYHDYAHHPKQIENMLEVSKNIVKKTRGKVIVVFEPHTYSRTKALINEFAKSFETADHVIFAPVYSARELPSAGFDSLKLANETKKRNKNVEHIETFKDIKSRVLSLAKKGDVVMILGAGTIEKLAKMFWLKLSKKPCKCWKQKVLCFS